MEVGSFEAESGRAPRRTVLGRLASRPPSLGCCFLLLFASHPVYAFVELFFVCLFVCRSPHRPKIVILPPWSRMCSHVGPRRTPLRWQASRGIRGRTAIAVRLSTSCCGPNRLPRTKRIWNPSDSGRRWDAGREKVPWDGVQRSARRSSSLRVTCGDRRETNQGRHRLSTKPTSTPPRGPPLR